MLVGKRRRLLNYLMDKEIERYRAIKNSRFEKVILLCKNERAPFRAAFSISGFNTYLLL